ncbi:MAG: serine/threonine protein kinase [Chloroflexi bacterium]|nr:MAG: serine/threonine protein kinase [Chloroflexota bacterium]
MGKEGSSLSFNPGTTLGSYLIVEQIGRGGMATVYKAYEEPLTRHVAIKVLPEFFAEDKDYRVRFQVEAVAVAKLRHNNILTVFAYGEEEGVPYIVCEFVDGGTLAERLDGAMPIEDAVQVLVPVASALDYAHSQGVLHRDIKPSNIMLLSDGTPVLTDFGLAKVLGGDTITVTGQVLGTPEYMAPELVSGDSAGPAADRYSLGVVAYQMLTGRVPFQGNTPGATLMAQIHDPLPPARDLNPELSVDVAVVLDRALSKAPAERYESAGDFIAALAAAGLPAVLEAG